LPSCLHTQLILCLWNHRLSFLQVFFRLGRHVPLVGLLNTS
jgi:hypothetical protein